MNGQTIKTKIVTNELDKQFGADQVVKIDTHGGAKALPSVVFQMIKAFRECDIDTLINVGNNLDLLLSKKPSCLKEAEKYKAENVIQCLISKF